MINLGDLSLAQSPGEIERYQANFASELASGDSIADVATSVSLWQYSAVPDASAASLAIAGASAAGTIVSGWFGALNGAGLPGATYTAWFRVTTSLGATLYARGNFTYDPLTPPSFGGGGSLPTQQFTFAASGSPATPGDYYVTATGLTAAIPSGSVGGDMVFYDMTGAVDPQFSFSGTALNRASLSDVLPPGGKVTLHWSPKYQGFIVP